MWNPLALTAAEERQNQDSVTTQHSGADDGGPSHDANNFGADFLFPPFSSLDFADFPRHNIQADRHSYPSESKNENNMLCLDWNRLTDSKTDADTIDLKNDKSEFSMNFMPSWCESPAGYPIRAHGVEARSSRISRLPMSSSSGTHVLPLVGNFGATGNNKNNLSNVPLPYSSPKNLDGNFLSLGIGSGTEIKSNSKFSTREIANKLGDTVFSQYGSPIVGKSLTSPWNPTRSTKAQTAVGGLSSSALPGSSRLNPIQFPDLPTPQANPQSSFSPMYDNVVFDLNASSSRREIPKIPQRGHVTQNPLGPTSLASQLLPGQQPYSRRSSVNASESSRNYLSGMHRGSPISHAQLGRLIPVTEARRTQNIAGVHFPESVQPVGNSTSQAEDTSTGVATIRPFPSSVQPVVHSVASLGNNYSPDGSGFPIPRVNTIQSAAAGTFPRRLGVQPSEPVIRTTGGTPANCLRPQAYLVRPLVLPGQHQHGMPTQLPTNFPRADSSSGQVTPVTIYGASPQVSLVSRPHFKRRATVIPSTAQSSQRRKITHQPVMQHSSPGQRPSFPGAPPPVPAMSQIPPSRAHHIKWQGFDEPRKPSGHKCLLCKRDLSFTSEGQVYQPAIPPAVAVLPCGHTFHDDCLQRITMEDHSKNPPCIPCAIGET